MPRQTKTRTYGTKRGRQTSKAERMFVEVKQSAAAAMAATTTTTTMAMTITTTTRRKTQEVVEVADVDVTAARSVRRRTRRVIEDDDDEEEEEDGQSVGTGTESENKSETESENDDDSDAGTGDEDWTTTPAPRNEVDELALQVSTIKITEATRRSARKPRTTAAMMMMESPTAARMTKVSPPSPASTPSPTRTPKSFGSTGRKLFPRLSLRPSLSPSSSSSSSQKTPSTRLSRTSIRPSGGKPTPRRSIHVPPTPPSSRSSQQQQQPRELRILSWAEVCPPGDTITKIAEASFAEVYRVTNALGTSIIKTIRLPSPIKAQTAAQVRAELVDEEPHSEADVAAELQISEWLAAVPGFVVYKERYVVSGRATAALLDTHRKFHNKMKRRDPDRLQFYPSPARYLDETRFLVVELGDAGTALEDLEIGTVEEVWDIFLLVALALARAEEWAMFEHRDLHEGNVCVKRVRPARRREDEDKSRDGPWFGYSGLDITILDYGISRASCPGATGVEEPVAYDLERDLSLFTSTHAPQCAVYRQMRSHLLRGDRICLPPKAHNTPYELTSWDVDEDEDEEDDSPDEEESDAASDSDSDADPLVARSTKPHRQPNTHKAHAPISWTVSAPYTNVLWLAYLYAYLAGRGPAAKGAAFKGPNPALKEFRRETQELRRYLDPDEGEKGGWPSFGSAGEVVRFAVEAGWIAEEEVLGGVGDEGGTLLSVLREDEVSIIRGGQGEVKEEEGEECGGGEEEAREATKSRKRRSPRLG